MGLAQSLKKKKKNSFSGIFQMRFETSTCCTKWPAFEMGPDGGVGERERERKIQVIATAQQQLYSLWRTKGHSR